MEIANGRLGICRFAANLHNHKTQDCALYFRHIGKQDIHLNRKLAHQLTDDRLLSRLADKLQPQRATVALLPNPRQSLLR